MRENYFLQLTDALFVESLFILQVVKQIIICSPLSLQRFNFFSLWLVDLMRQWQMYHNCSNPNSKKALGRIEWIKHQPETLLLELLEAVLVALTLLVVAHLSLSGLHPTPFFVELVSSVTKFWWVTTKQWENCLERVNSELTWGRAPSWWRGILCRALWEGRELRASRDYRQFSASPRASQLESYEQNLTHGPEVRTGRGCPVELWTGL